MVPPEEALGAVPAGAASTPIQPNGCRFRSGSCGSATRPGDPREELSRQVPIKTGSDGVRLKTFPVRNHGLGSNGRARSGAPSAGFALWDR